MTRALATVFVLALLAGTGAAQQGTDPTTLQSHIDAAAEYYRVGNFEAALAEYEAAFAIDPNPDYLYAMATIEDQRGGCARAIEYYQRFLDTQPPEEDVVAVTQQIDACKQKLGVSDEPEVKPEPEPTYENPAPMLPPRLVHRPWYTDRLGIALAVGGVAGLGTGGAFYLLARGARADAEVPGISLDEYDARWASAQSRQRIAWIAAGAGGALLIGGVLHILLADRDHLEDARSPQVQVGPGDVGVALAGTF